MATIRTVIQLRRDTTENWTTNKDVIPAEGEPCLDLDTGVLKIGDGVTTYENLAEIGGSAAEATDENYYDAVGTDEQSDTDVITATIGETEVHDGDTFVVKRLIADDKYSYTAYVYDEGVWAALDGNVNAANVILADDMTVTYAFGKYIPEDGSVTIASSGMSFAELLEDAFSEDVNPTVTEPTFAIYVSGFGTYEVGTSVTPSYTTSFTAGEYEFGPDPTGVTAESYSITDGSETLTTESGSFSALTVTDSTSYTVSGSVTYTDGEVPLTALGNEYADGQITAGTLTASAKKSATNSTSRIAGYRNTFYGTVEDKEAEVTSDVIRGLTASGKALSAGSTFTITIPVGAMRVIFAYPSTLEDVASVTDTNGLGAEISSAFTLSLLSVEGANGYDAIDYKVYTLDYANANDTANTYKVTI